MKHLFFVLIAILYFAGVSNAQHVTPGKKSVKDKFYKPVYFEWANEKEMVFSRYKNGKLDGFYRFSNHGNVLEELEDDPFDGQVYQCDPEGDHVWTYGVGAEEIYITQYRKNGRKVKAWGCAKEGTAQALIETNNLGWSENGQFVGAAGEKFRVWDRNGNQKLAVDLPYQAMMKVGVTNQGTLVGLGVKDQTLKIFHQTEEGLTESDLVVYEELYDMQMFIDDEDQKVVLVGLLGEEKGKFFLSNSDGKYRASSVQVATFSIANGLEPQQTATYGFEKGIDWLNIADAEVTDAGVLVALQPTYSHVSDNANQVRAEDIQLLQMDGGAIVNHREIKRDHWRRASSPSYFTAINLEEINGKAHMMYYSFQRFSDPNHRLHVVEVNEELKDVNHGSYDGSKFSPDHTKFKELLGDDYEGLIYGYDSNGFADEVLVGKFRLFPIVHDRKHEWKD